MLLKAKFGKIKPERFRTEQEETEKTEAPKGPVTVGVVFGVSPFSECSRILKNWFVSFPCLCSLRYLLFKCMVAGKTQTVVGAIFVGSTSING